MKRIFVAILAFAAVASLALPAAANPWKDQGCHHGRCS